MAGTERRRDGELFLGEPDGVSWNYSKKFALLYNVQRQMYTIGGQFECRKCQGEFLLCTGDGVSKSSHCEITCGEEGKFLVKDLQGLSGRGTFINGERIQSRMELQFGDILSLGGPGPKITLNADREGQGVDLNHARVENRGIAGTVFLFQAVPEIADSVSHLGSQSSDPNINSVGNCHPLRNSLVISKIFGYLPLPVVKKCRLVCSEWNDEATKILKNNAVAVFKYWNRYLTSENRSRLFAFVQEMGQFFTAGRFRIKLPRFPGPNCDMKGQCWCQEQGYVSCATLDVSGNLKQKMLSDLRWFFDMDEGFRHPVTKLSLEGTICCNSGRNLFLAVLQGGSLQLEDLKLDMQLNLFKSPSPVLPKPFDILFPSLKKLSIVVDSFTSRHICRCPFEDDDDDFDDPVFMDNMKKWVTSMITAAPKLESLELASSHLKCQQFAQPFLLRINEEGGFQNLNSLNLHTYNYSILESIIKLPSLMSLTLKEFHRDFDYDDGLDGEGEEDDRLPWTALMRNVLEKSAKSLKHLDLAMPVFPRLKKNQNLDAFHFPVLPNLKVLKLRNFYSNCIALSELGLNFEDYFPILETFCVDWNWNRTHQYKVHLQEKHFFEIFFPRVFVEHFKANTSTNKMESKVFSCPIAKKKGEEQVVNCVRHLEIVNLEKWDPAAVNWIDKLFPNAFKQLETNNLEEY